MKTKTLTGTIKKAVIELMILKLLSEEDMYGYQITQELKKRSSGQFTILEGSMYPILYRLRTAATFLFMKKRSAYDRPVFTTTLNRPAKIIFRTC